MLSVSRGISSSYSCGNPCPPHYDYGYTDPDPTDLPEGDSAAHNVLEIDADSYENQYGPYSASVVAASTFDTNIATFDGYSVYGVFEGDTTTSATVEYPLYWWEIGTYDCVWYGTNQTSVYGSVQVQGVKFLSATDDYSSTSFSGTSATLPVSCGGERFVLRIRFRGPDDTTGFCTSTGLDQCLVKLSDENKFEWAPSPIHPEIKYQFHPEGTQDDPRPYVDIGLRRRGDNGGTTKKVAISVSGTRELGSGTFSGNGTVTLNCDN